MGRAKLFSTATQLVQLCLVLARLTESKPILESGHMTRRKGQRKRRFFLTLDDLVNLQSINVRKSI